MAAHGERERPFREPVDDPQRIRGMIFGGFSRCLCDKQKFDSDSERRMAVVLESDPTRPKWFRPTGDDIRIYLSHGEGQYEPDFVAENAEKKYIIEVKRAAEMDDPDVQGKAEAGALWCARASEASGSRWVYLLVPHDQISDASTLAGLEARFAVAPRRE
jgi:type III restriction enzyme